MANRNHDMVIDNETFQQYRENPHTDVLLDVLEVFKKIKGNHKVSELTETIDTLSRTIERRLK